VDNLPAPEGSVVATDVPPGVEERLCRAFDRLVTEAPASFKAGQLSQVLVVPGRSVPVACAVPYLCLGVRGKTERNFPLPRL
jgi:hypothetical protein